MTDYNVFISATLPKPSKSNVYSSTGPYVTGQSRKIFYHNGRIWVFYVTPDAKFYFKTSTDGKTWSSPTFLHNTSYQFATSGQIWFDGTYVHLAVKESPKIYYRRGIPESNGTITWSADWQTAIEPSPFPSTAGDISICVDSDGYPWIVWIYENVNGGTGALQGYISGSSTNNGVWNTKAGYPLQITTGSANNYREVLIVPLLSRDIYAIMFRGDRIIYGRYYTQSTDTWGALETVSTSQIINSYPPGAEMWSWNSVVDKNEDVHLVFTSNTFSIEYTRRVNTSGLWEAETQLDTEVLESATPVMAIDYDLSNLYILWVGSDSHIYLKKKLSGTWVPTLDYLDYSALGFPADLDYGDDRSLSISRRVDSKDALHLLVCSNTVSPYDLWYQKINEPKVDFDIGGSSYTTPMVSAFTSGSTITITMPDPFGEMAWVKWSDGPTNRIRELIVSAETVLEAEYVMAYTYTQNLYEVLSITSKLNPPTLFKKLSELLSLSHYLSWEHSGYIAAGYKLVVYLVKKLRSTVRLRER